MKKLIWGSLVLASTAFATPGTGGKCALIIGGQANSVENVDKDFGRNVTQSAYGLAKKGYAVTVLTDWEDDSEPMKLLRTFSGVTLGQATPDSVDSYFKNATACTQVEVIVHAHGGQCDCDGDDSGFGSTDPNDLTAPDNHHFVLAHAPTCNPTMYYESKDLAEGVKSLDQLGIPVTMSLGSCFAGRVKKEITDLKNSCVLTDSSGNSEGMGCGDEDKPWMTDYTTLMEVADFRYMADYLGDLKQMPYFSNDICFNKVVKHFEEIAGPCYQKTGSWSACVGTLRQAFWLGRLHDESPTEPALSSLFVKREGGPDAAVAEYFTNDHFGRAPLESEAFWEYGGIANGFHLLKLGDVAGAVSQLVNGVVGAPNDGLQSLEGKLGQAVEAYNQHIGQDKADLKKLIEQAQSDDSEDGSDGVSVTKDQIDAWQHGERIKATAVIDTERTIVNELYQTKPDAFGSAAADPCNRPL